MNRRHQSAISILQSVFCISFLATIAFWIACVSQASACPFCTAVKPTLAQQCDSATVAFLGECVDGDANKENTGGEFAVRRPLKGKESLADHATVRIKSAQNIKPGTLALLLGSGEKDVARDELDWQCIPVAEAGFAYLGRLPDLRAPTEERLKYFAKFLEHSDPLLAEDAFLEFGHAPYDKVMQVGDILSAAKLRQWIVNANVPAERKGFYGLALGLTAHGEERKANVALLKKLVDADVAPGGDFRTGFDGVLGGYLMADGPAALDRITQRIVADLKAAEGDVRHAQTALRFYYEFGPKDDREAVATTVERLLARPGVAAAAITDLARWQQWSALPQITPLYDRRGYADPVTQRAVIGYLLACPLTAAADALDKLRQRDPHGVAAAEKTLEALGGKN